MSQKWGLGINMRAIVAQSKTYESFERLLEDDEDDVIKLLLDWKGGSLLPVDVAKPLSKNDIANLKGEIDANF